MSNLESIADLPLEERHAIVRGWLETLTTIYEQAAAERDVLRSLVREAQPTVCSMLCPSVWKTGEERPHCTLCQAMRAALQRGEP